MFSRVRTRVINYKQNEGVNELTAKQIKESLTKQLSQKGANVNHFASLIEDYLFYWNKEREMQKDIRTNGIKYKRLSAQGHSIEVENPSIKSAVMYNKQKLAILKELGLTTDNCGGEDDEL